MKRRISSELLKLEEILSPLESGKFRDLEIGDLSTKV
jgi:hypothetical protein